MRIFRLTCWCETMSEREDLKQIMHDLKSKGYRLGSMRATSIDPETGLHPDHIMTFKKGLRKYSVLVRSDLCEVCYLPDKKAPKKIGEVFAKYGWRARPADPESDPIECVSCATLMSKLD